MNADDPHTKASLLLQAHLSRLPLPISDYLTDTKTVLDNSLRILQAIVDVAAAAGWADTALSAMHLVQALIQSRWNDDHPALMLPGVSSQQAAERLCHALPALVAAAVKDPRGTARAVEAVVGPQDVRAACAALERMPLVEVSVNAVVKKKNEISAADDEEGSLNGGGSSDTTTTTAGTAGPHHQTWILEIQIMRKGGKSPPRGGTAPRVYAPHFPKIKEEGWWVVAVAPGSKELLALKRVSFSSQKTTMALSFSTDKRVAMRSVEVKVVSDSYLGLDQQVVVQLGQA